MKLSKADCFLAFSHNHAAPLTPLDDPCADFTIGVLKKFDAMYGMILLGISSYNSSISDIPPPQTMTSGSKMFTIELNDRAVRSKYLFIILFEVLSPFLKS